MEHGAKPGKGIINDAVGKKADINIIKCLIANGAKISEESLREYLCTYVKERPIEITKYLIENGTDINWRPRDPTDSQDSALSCSVNRNDMPTVKYLVSKGADVNIYFDDGRGNPLREAACNGNFDMVKYLISNGADVNVPKDGKGKTPLIYYIYCSKGTPEIAEYLIKKGADINAKDESGHDAKYWLRQVNDDTKKQKLSEILGIK
ncbi:MAG: ankyrin repeat domain-containing protein [Elusimicrobiota bacterium]|jgi:ankyrin repeat protein|nr:ankyrin repeat domain-containing protein [Elusimicrobiota bacterium]